MASPLPARPGREAAGMGKEEGSQKQLRRVLTLYIGTSDSNNFPCMLSLLAIFCMSAWRSPLSPPPRLLP